MKDVPMTLADPFEICAITKRENPTDAFISNHYDNLQALPPGSIIGTSSLRRQSLIHHLYPGLKIQTLRGNLQTRLSKLDDGQYDAIILASAGLIRLGLESRIKTNMSAYDFIPAVGQGALGIEVVVYEPVLTEDEFFNSRVIKDLEEFKKISDVIIANRKSDELADVDAKIYTRDLFGNDS